MCRKNGTTLTDSSAGNVVPYVDPVCDIMIMAWLIESQAELSLVGNVVDDGMPALTGQPFMSLKMRVKQLNPCQTLYRLMAM